MISGKNVRSLVKMQIHTCSTKYLLRDITYVTICCIFTYICMYMQIFSLVSMTQAAGELALSKISQLDIK